MNFSAKKIHTKIYNFEYKNIIPSYMYILSIIPFTKIPLPAPQTLDYYSTQKTEIGTVVEIKISKRLLLGVVVACQSVLNKKQDIKRASYRLKSIEKVVSQGSVFPIEFLKLVIWTSSYYYSPLGLVLKTLSPQVFAKPTQKFMKELLMWGVRPPTLKKVSETKPILYANADEKAKFRYYNQNIQKTLNAKKSVFGIIPELYRIDYLRKKISALKDATSVHSKLTKRAQWEIWKKAMSGEASCFIGTRAALAIWLGNLGLVIADDEGSNYHKSFDMQPYINARDVAIKMAKLTKSKIILGTSLPSLESFWKANESTYQLRRGQTPRGGSDPALVRLTDMRQELKEGNFSIFSRELKDELKKTIENPSTSSGQAPSTLQGSSGQAILFINKKGMATGLLCRDCGYIVKCPNCDVPMTYHQAIRSSKNPTPHVYNLICHRCALRKVPPNKCPQCASERIKFMGTGTQRVKDELEKFCQFYKITTISAIIDAEHTPTWQDQEKIFDAFKKGKISILIGTQMMLKTELLPKVDWTAVVTLDPILSMPDFSIGERIFETLQKVGEVSKNKVILQSYLSENYLLKSILEVFQLKQGQTLLKAGSDPALAHFKKFAKKELEMREGLSFPPFSQIIKLSYLHANPQKAEQEAKILKNKLDLQVSNHKIPNTKLQILGPAPAFVPRQKNRYIWQIMLKSKIQDLALRNKLLRVVTSDWKIDVDPIETL